MRSIGKTTMVSATRRFLILCAVAAALNVLWERSHVGLYTSYERLTDLPITYYAVAGDVMYTLFAVFVVSLFKGRLDWVAALSARDIVGLALLGFWIAIFVEYKALALHSWAYLDTMPILPFFNVGLTPVLQMAILLPLSVFLVSEIDKAVRRLS